MKINYLINELLTIGLEKNILDELNYDYSVNLLLDIFALNSFTKEQVNPRSLDDVLEDLANFAYEQNLINSNDVTTFDNFKAKVVDALLDQPNMVQHKFDSYYSKSPSEATSYLYQLSKNCNYIQTTRISKNISYTHNCKYGELQVTINLSKPEKDPKIIAQALTSSDSNKYPKCQLCRQNVGYRGRINYDGRSNLRAVKITLGNELWYFQYSPYSYFNEHSIVLNSIHQPMVINTRAFSLLFDFVDIFPEYFIGSNADLPIVGGSILNHEHFQAGRHHFPIEVAEERFVKKVKDVEVIKVKWPLSTIRLKSQNKASIINCASRVLELWRKYQNKALDIINSEEDLHNTITPIVRKMNNTYVIDLILRCNYQNDLHPLGVFHPHSNLHHIKKENIGLIEAMGLAILPARLKGAVEKIAQYLDGDKNIINDKALEIHYPWIKEIEKGYTANSYQYVLDEIGKVFIQVLEDAGVFKDNEEGQNAFQKFIEQI